MCPEFRKGVCELAGIEPDEIMCASETYCINDNWVKCSVYISQFFIAAEEKLEVA